MTSKKLKKAEEDEEKMVDSSESSGDESSVEDPALNEVNNIVPCRHNQTKIIVKFLGNSSRIRRQKPK